MIGARRCGKSSTLVSMLSSLESLDQNISVSFSDEQTKINLRRKQSEMKLIFSDESVKSGFWTDNGENGSSSLDTYSIDITIHQKLLIHVNCTDIPGEIIANDMRKLQEVSQNCDAIIVAVDTPQLMENKQKGILANYVNDFTDFSQILVGETKMRNKRIILVPLKCEKYVHECRMDEVVNRIKVVYSDFVRLWKEIGKSDCFITPVQTLGGLEFDHFERRKMGNGKSFDLAYYKYTGNKNYSPRNCEQPILYAIDYAIHKVSWEHKTNWILKSVKNTTKTLKRIFS